MRLRLATYSPGSLVWLAALISFVWLAVACRGRDSCLQLDAALDPQRAIAVCRAELARSRDARAAIAVVDAYTKLADDAATIAWAQEVGELPGTAKVWRRAAQAHLRRGEPEAMIAAVVRSMRLWEQAGQPGEAAYDASLLQDQYYAQGKLLLALQISQRQRALALSSDDAIMRWGSFQNLFAILDEVGDYAAAKALLREVQRSTDPADLPAMRSLRFCEGLMFFREGRLELAKLAYRDGLAMVDSATTQEALRPDYYNLVELEVLLGDVDAAAAHLAAAVASIPPDAEIEVRCARAFFTALVLRARGDAAGAEAAIRAVLGEEVTPLWKWQLEELLGKALEDQGRNDEALAAYQRSIIVIEAVRKELAIDVLQVALRERKRAPYEAAFDLLASRGDVAAAMQIAQAMWQRGFVESFDVSSELASADGVGGGGAGGAAGGGDAGLARLRSLSALAPQLEHPARGGAAVSATTTKPSSSSSSKPSSKPSPSPSSSPSMPDDAPDAPDAPDVLAFVEARGRLWRYQRVAARAQLERLALPAAEARRLVGELRARPDEPASAVQLAAALLPPSVVAPASRARPLALIADGALAGLPFAALRLGARYLVQDRTLLYWPALEPLGQAHRAAAPAAPVGAAAAMDHSRAALAVLAPSTDKGAALPSAHAEVVELSLMIGASPLLGEQATIAALRGSGGARLLHLAAHGGLAPGGAFVRMADGDVTATDIVTWKLAPRVVVLASCASGARPSGSMWGALGGAFLAAGSESVVATLWSVEDDATARLVAAFYAAGGQRDPALALAEAQRKAIAAGVSPRQWAAFVTLAES